MRVIAGSARGTRLFAPRGMETRPTADRVREALFNVIQNQFEINGLRVLDICAGTGGLGIEALSRGAACCSFVENSREALKCLKRNLHASHCFDRASLMEMNLTRALPLLAGRGDRFDLIFLDPPYTSNLYTTVLRTISTDGLLAPEGILVAEIASRSPLPETVEKLRKTSRRVYGDTALEIYSWEK